MARFDLHHPALTHLLDRVQDGVVSRRQLLDLGATPDDVRRMLRRRELSDDHPGVYLNHTGAPSRAQREWIAVLAAWPAALSHESALSFALPDPGRVLHVAVERGRKVVPPRLVRVHACAGLADRVAWRSAPPMVRIEHATIDVLSNRIRSGDVASAFAVLTDILHTRRTNPDAILHTLDSRERVAGRATVAALLADVRDGACSVLERGYLHRVERAHGLPRGTRQRQSRATGRRTDQDVHYDGFGLIVELDGRAHHSGARAWDADARRDLAELAIADDLTARVTYGMVFGDGCRTAEQIAQLLHRRGWTGRLNRCPRC
ncbi:hypothetical protein FXB39_05430 [Nocardioides sp. BGMRC 2183]|nr:hypothetical protein FXB39_05430 [Nocardioides sp. BGMRC 2183]